MSNRQQSAVQNANSFLQTDMANLSNRNRQTCLKAQQRVHLCLQTKLLPMLQHSLMLQPEPDRPVLPEPWRTVSQFNATQQNAQAQFNAGQANTVNRFNAE